MIRLEHLHKTFDTAQGTVAAVRDVSINVAQGEIFGVIGFSGAGKSTLVRCINLLERPESGQVLIDGVDLTALDDRRLREQRKKIGMIFQHFNLFPSRTVAENVAYPLKRSGLSKGQIANRVDELLNLVGLTEKAGVYPSQLSGGQKQRVGIARALANKPSILLCDEATSALDPQTTQSILGLLRDLNRTLGLTIVIVTHEMQVIKSTCHRAAIMERGQVIETGTTFDLFANPAQRLTRDFIATTSSLSKIDALVAEGSPIVKLKGGELLAKLSYVGRNAAEALISAVSIRYDVLVNIIFGDLEIVQNTPLGGLIVIVSGEDTNLMLALLWFADNGVKVEVIKHG
jgi:D-methionine transport system ATP-binding protein